MQAKPLRLFFELIYTSGISSKKDGGRDTQTDRQNPVKSRAVGKERMRVNTARSPCPVTASGPHGNDGRRV